MGFATEVQEDMWATEIFCHRNYDDVDNDNHYDEDDDESAHEIDEEADTQAKDGGKLIVMVKIDKIQQ